MTTVIVLLALIAAALVITAILTYFAGPLLNRDKRVAEVDIVDPSDSTTTDATGAVRSIQGADLYVLDQAVQEIWTPMHLERLARTYWRFLTRATLGLIRVVYTDRERFVVLLFAPLKLLTFQAPEYEMNAERGVVRWRIERGLLVARQGRGGNGYLQIDVQRCRSERPDRARLHVDVEVANFYPAIASGIGRWVYNETQSRIHVIVTHAFLRSLARLDLGESRVGRFAQSIDELPDPPPQGEQSPRHPDRAAAA